MNKRFGSFSSSANPEALGRKWQGVFLTISTVCGAIATFIGLPIVASVLNLLGLGDNLSQLAGSIATIGTTIGILGGATLGAYGAIYNIFVIVYDKYLSKIPFLN